MNFELVAPASRRLSGRHLAFPTYSSFPGVAGVHRLHRQDQTFHFLSRLPDPGYASALAAANRFLQAWQNQDHETGLLMLTDIAKQNSSEDRLEIFFSSGRDAAYEIARGKKLKAGRYAFPVALFVSVTSTANAARPQKSEIVVVRAGKDEWAIDKLP